MHGLDLLVSDQTKQLANVDEMDEAGVELLVGVHVPERVQPMAMVDVGVAAHHLAVDRLDVGFKGLRETGGLSEPLPAGELGERSVDVGRRKGLRGAHWSQGTSRVGCGREVDVGGVGREDGGVIDLADDPFLDEIDILDGGDFDGFFVVIQPSVRVASLYE